MLKRLRGLIPKKVKVILNKVSSNFKLVRLVTYDFFRYKNHSFGISNNKDRDYMRARIIINYHSIEKGLSNINPKMGFGKRPVKNLVDLLNEYVKLGYPLEDSQVKAGVSTLKKYIEVHKQNDFDVSWLEQQINNLNGIKDNDLGGVEKSLVINYKNLENKNFEEIAYTRKSIRDFSDEEILYSTIEKALKIAETTPSVCNRQPWRVHIIQNKELIDKVLTIQGGFRGFGSNIQYLIGICADFRYLSGPKEKDQGYFDSGLYTMNLVYGLTSLGVANCIINGQFTIKEDKQIRKILELGEFEKITAFIVTGSYPEEFYWTKSLRDDYSTYTLIH